MESLQLNDRLIRFDVVAVVKQDRRDLSVNRGRYPAFHLHRFDGLFAPEDIRPREADPGELAVAAAACAAIPFAAPAYARIDLIRDDRGGLVVLELELTEPSLFLAHAQGAAERLARRLVQRLQSLESAR